MPKKPTRQVIAENVLRLRTENKWSQTFLAALMRLDRGHISKIETTQVSVTVDTLDRLAEAFQTTVIELLTESSEGKVRAPATKARKRAVAPKAGS